MAGIRKSELKAMDEKTARERLVQLKTELMKLNAQVAVGTNIESPGRIKATKRNIARLLTLLNSKKKALILGKSEKLKLEVKKTQSVFQSSNKLEVKKKE